MTNTRKSARLVARKAWRAVPRQTRGELIVTVFQGQRPDDTESWRAMRNWAALYPAQALPATLMSIAFLVIGLGFPNVWGRLRWFYVAWACLVLVSAAFLICLSWATRRNPGPNLDAPQ